MGCEYCEKDAVHRCSVCGRTLCAEHAKLQTVCPSCIKKNSKRYNIDNALPAKDKEKNSIFVTELKVGRPSLDISTVKTRGSEFIESTTVRRSAPCGSTWYIAKKLLGAETKTETLYDTVAKAHHSYPCTATMAVDPEAKEPILHIAGYIIRQQVEKALKQARMAASRKNTNR